MINLKDKLEDGVVVSEINKYILEFHSINEDEFDFTIYSNEGNLIDGGDFMWLENNKITYGDLFDHVNYVLDKSDFDENATLLDEEIREEVLDMINEISTYQFELSTILEVI